MVPKILPFNRFPGEADIKNLRPHFEYQDSSFYCCGGAGSGVGTGAGVGDGAQGLMHNRQELYHSVTSSYIFLWCVVLRI